MSKYFNNKKAKQKERQDMIVAAATENMERARISGMRVGASGILGAILNMCKEGKSVDDIRGFCEKSLNLDGMKDK